MNTTPQAINSAHYDLIVIGGGINGTGVARDAALRGMKVLLLEKNDFGAGTSAHSSRLIHGGLRYLAHMELGLVHESLQERERLLHNAPHLVRPLPMAIPLYPGTQNPPLMVGIGMGLYDLLSLNKTLPRHRFLSPQKFMAEIPGIRRTKLLGGPVYYDAQVDFPERLCLENMLSAIDTGHATALTHTEVTAIQANEAEFPQVTFRNTLTGETECAIGSVIINASGPWVDILLQSLAPGRRFIGATKGSHIVVPRFSTGPKTALYVEAQSDGRPFFIIPWREQYYLIGTTDLPFEDNPDHVAASLSEVQYLLNETNAILPKADLTLQDIVYTYSGLRPLPYQPNNTKAGRITRRHHIEAHGKRRVISLIGGKLTTYRHFAEEAVDYAIREFQLRNPAEQLFENGHTANRPLPGSNGIQQFNQYQQEESAKSAAHYNISEETVAHLINLYGSRYKAVLELCPENPAFKEPFHPNENGITAQVIYAIRAEMAHTLSDVILRRLGLITTPHHPAIVEAISHIMAHECHWTEGRRIQEVNHYTQWLTETVMAFQHEA